MSKIVNNLLDIECGEYPRLFYEGDGIVRRDECEKDRIMYHAGIPVEPNMDENIQERLLTEKAKFLNAEFVNGSYREIIQFAKRTDHEKKTFINKIKTFYIRDLLNNGLPKVHIGDTIDYFFQQKRYTFNVEDLTISDILRFPLKSANSQFANGYPMSQLLFLEFAENGIYLPALCDGEYVLFHMQNKAAKELLIEYHKYLRRYLNELNNLIKFIHDYDFDKKDFKTFWMNLYGNSDYYAEVERIKMK